MSGETFSDASMLEIFRAEVETHVEALTSGLLALERDPGDTSHIDEMMRGAHSIKGAARIVGIDPAVRVAHVMEDGFVAAQNGKLKLRPEHVDVLLRAVDMLNRIANGSKDSAFDLNQFDAEATPLVAEITSVLAGNSVASSKPVLKSEPAPNPATQSATAKFEEITIPIPEFFHAAAAETVRLALIAGIDSGAALIRFDLSKTEDIDATALALLAAAANHIKTTATKTAAGQAPQVELYGAGPDLNSVFQATGIDRLYSVGGR